MTGLTRVEEVLSMLRQPCDLRVLAERTGLPNGLLKGLLDQLLTRGYVASAEPGVGACSSGCGSCAMQNFCPSQEPAIGLSKPRVWRLTPLGEKQLK